MSVIYRGNPPTEDGTYLVRVNDMRLEIAELDTFGNAGDLTFHTWSQIGSDFDLWDNGGADTEIDIIRKLDLDELASAGTVAPTVAQQPEPEPQTSSFREALETSFGKKTAAQAKPTRIEYTTAMGEAAQAYFNSFEHVRIHTPGTFRFEILWNVMQAAAGLSDPTQYKVGPLTMQYVFTPAKLTNLSDLQAVLDQTETAFAAVPAQAGALLEILQRWRDGYGFNEGSDEDVALLERADNS